MKKQSMFLTILFVLLSFMMIACNPNPAEPTTYQVTLVYNNGTANKIEEVDSNSEYKLPVAPTKEGYDFIGWYIGETKCGDTVKVDKDITIEARYKVIQIEVANLCDIPEIKSFFQDISNTKFGMYIKEDKSLEFDGEGKYVVTEWQDVWTYQDLTIENIVFKEGLSIHTAHTEGEIKVRIEGCEIYAMDQKVIYERNKDNANFRMDNSGDGLCLGFDSTTTAANVEDGLGKVIFEAVNNKLIGKGDINAIRKGWRDMASVAGGDSTRSDPRGRGISLGLQAGNCKNLTSALIDGNTFDGIRCGDIQLSGLINTTVTIKNNKFNGWGINKEVKDGIPYDYAIRGDISNAIANNSTSITLENNTYASTWTDGTTVLNLEEKKVGIDRWNQNSNGYDQSRAQ